MESQEILKAKILQAKSEIEQKQHQFISDDNRTKINIQYSTFINEIVFNHIALDKELIIAINKALSEVKIKIAQDYSAKLLEMGIKM